MAKLRRKSTPPSKSSTAKPKAKPAPAKVKPTPKSKAPAKSATKGRLRPGAKTPAKAVTKPRTAPPPQPAPRRSTYVDAVALYERGVQFLQTRRYREAAETLTAVISQYPEEKELHERARLYILVCERGIAAAPAKSESPEDRIFAATLAINNGAIDQAITLLSSVVQADPDHDHATYMLGVSHALRGNTELALQHLARSMALNPENRDLARKDPDLDVLRRTDSLAALLASPPAPIPRKDKRPAPRAKRG